MDSIQIYSVHSYKWKREPNGGDPNLFRAQLQMEKRVEIKVKFHIDLVKALSRPQR